MGCSQSSSKHEKRGPTRGGAAPGAASSSLEKSGAEKTVASGQKEGGVLETISLRLSGKSAPPPISKAASLREGRSSDSIFLTSRRMSEADSKLKWDEKLSPSRDKKELLRKALLGNPHFKHELELRRVSGEDIDLLVESMRLMIFGPSETVYKTGDSSEHQLLYVVEEGYFQLYRGEAPTGKCSPGAVFGEIEFLSNTYRQYSAFSQPAKKGLGGGAKAYALRRGDYEMVVEKGRHMDNIELFSKLSKEQKMQLKSRMIVSSYRPGEMIVRKGENVKCLFIILSGEVKHDSKPFGEGSGRITTPRDSRIDFGDNPDTVHVLGTDEFFGADTVLEDCVQAASVRAITSATVCKMNRSLFFVDEKTYGPLRKIVLKMVKDREEHKERVRRGESFFIRKEGSGKKFKKGNHARIKKWTGSTNDTVDEISSPSHVAGDDNDDNTPFACGVFNF